MLGATALNLEVVGLEEMKKKIDYLMDVEAWERLDSQSQSWSKYPRKEDYGLRGGFTDIYLDKKKL